VDEMMREANLQEVRDGINDLRSMNIKGRILSAVDGDGTMRKALGENPFQSAPINPMVTPAPVAEGARSHPAIIVPPVAGTAPAFVPPSAEPPHPPPAAAPAFIPPGAARDAQPS
jgi:sec-independent protein translocase protein TatB